MDNRHTGPPTFINLPIDTVILCNLNRMDQLGEEEFKCGAYEPKDSDGED